ncbi:MAG: AAA family ATPase [Bacteroidia bacterium]|nr:AAA family ATPase [Bacteroidia bacterium]
MKIQSIKLTNYRCFESLTLEFSAAHNLHVLLAENMVGKSALLKALRVSAGSFLNSFSQVPPGIDKSDHRVIGPNPLANLSRECRIETRAIIYDEALQPQEIVWEKYRNKPVNERTKIKTTRGPDIKRLSSRIYDSVAEDQKGALPLLLFLGTEYIHLAKASTKTLDMDGSALQGYWYCMSERSMETYVFDWLAHMDTLVREAENNRVADRLYGDLPEVSLQLFQKVVKGFLPDIADVAWIINPKPPQDATMRNGGETGYQDKVLAFMLENGDVRTYPMLSDGYRYLVLLAGEMATRALLLNKHLGITVNEHIPGVVLIDEFGIHLHPGLQREALQRLTAMFPKVQFIVSTHSPMLVNGLDKEQIHILEIDPVTQKRIHRQPEQDVVGLGAEGILLELFGMETTFDKETIANLERLKDLIRKQSSMDLDQQEKAELKQLQVETSHLSYERAELDPLYQKLTEELKRLSQNDTQTRGVQDYDALANEAIQKVIQDLSR